MDGALVGDVGRVVSLPDEPKQQEQFEKDAIAMVNESQTKQFPAIRKYMQDRITFYRDDLGGMDVKAMDLAKVGEKYIVCSLVTMELEALLAKIDITAQAVNESRGK